jgi:hypothetical protein
MIGNGGGFSAGATGGSADATLVSHNHTATSTVTDPGHNHNISMYEASAAPSGCYSGGPVGSSNGSCGDSSAFIVNNTTGVTVGTSISTVGSSATNANLQPYIVVYMWNRTA